MPDFAAVKELVEQHIDSYRCSRSSLVQTLTIRRPSLHGVASSSWIKCMDPWRLIAILLKSSFRVSAVALSLSTVKHGSFLFAYFLEQH